jgi:hypothetical protein
MFQSAFINPEAASAEWTYRTERLRGGRTSRHTSTAERRFTRGRRAS